MAEIFFGFNDQEKLASGNCGNTVRNRQMVMTFDDTTAESVIFSGVVPSDYSANTITIDVYWVAATATTGNVVWSLAVERSNTDMDSDSFNTARTVTDATNATSGIAERAEVTFTQAQADGLTAQDEFRVRLRRDAADAADTLVGDAQVRKLVFRY